jgi:hypothetical protein
MTATMLPFLQMLEPATPPAPIDVSATAPPLPSPSPAPAPAQTAAPPARRATETPAPPPRRARRPPEPAAVIDAAALRRASAGDPSVDDLRAAATALCMAEPERARSMLRRAAWAALLPEVRVRVDRRFGRSESLDVPSVPLDTPPPVGLDTVDEVRYEGRATWDLSRIVFNPDELNVHAEALRAADVRREIESTVIRLFFERRRLKVEAISAEPGDVGPGLAREIRIQEIEAELDALTGGAFTRAAAHTAVPSSSSWP